MSIPCALGIDRADVLLTFFDCPISTSSLMVVIVPPHSSSRLSLNTPHPDSIYWQSGHRFDLIPFRISSHSTHISPHQSKSIFIRQQPIESDNSLLPLARLHFFSIPPPPFLHDCLPIYILPTYILPTYILPSYILTAYILTAYRPTDLHPHGVPAYRQIHQAVRTKHVVSETTYPKSKGWDTRYTD